MVSLTYGDQSLSLKNLKTILLFLVVAIHCNLCFVHYDIREDFTCYYYFQYYIVEILAKSAVPTFFVISGYFMVFKDKTFDGHWFKSKLKSRIERLLIPYIIWNILYLIVYTSEKYLKGEDWASFLSYNLLRCFWATDTGLPIDYPLWYIRDLFLLIIVTPFLLYIIKSKLAFKVTFVVLFILYIYSDNINIGGVLFYLTGLQIGVNKILILNCFTSCRYLLVAIYMILSSVTLYLVRECGEEYNYSIIFRNITVVIGTFSFLSFAYLLNRNSMILSNLALSSFTLYLYHGYPANLLGFIVNNTSVH